MARKNRKRTDRQTVMRFMCTDGLLICCLPVPVQTADYFKFLERVFALVTPSVDRVLDLVATWEAEVGLRVLVEHIVNGRARARSKNRL